MIGQLLTTFGVLSLLSIGGANAVLPEIQRQAVLVHHWMTNATFAALTALAQASPGPNVIVASIIGLHLAGVLGLLAATAAMTAPSSIFILLVSRVAGGTESGVAARARQAMAPIAIGAMAASCLVMMQAAYRAPVSLLITIVAGFIVAASRVSPVWCMAGGALVGLIAKRLGLFA